jgi:hypothetical protein
MLRLKALILWTSLAALAAPAVAQMQNASPARPGTLNYIEGSATIDGQPLTPRSIGSAELNPGQNLTTSQGKAEMLLTPGIFLRLDDNSTVKMVTPDLTDTAVELQHGRATVEVDQIFPQNNIHIVENGIPTQLLKPGLYEFDADRGAVRVFEGEAAVADHNNHFVTVKAHHELALSEGANRKAHDFDVNASDELYNWSSLRSEYLAQANEQIAGGYASAQGFAPGWYWDPGFYGYTYIGVNPFWSPFGWGFYGRGFYGGGFYGRGAYYGRGYYGGGEGFHGGIGGGGFHGGGGGGHR